MERTDLQFDAFGNPLKLHNSQTNSNIIPIHKQFWGPCKLWDFQTEKLQLALWLLTNHAAIKLMLRDMADVHLHFQARELQNEQES